LKGFVIELILSEELAQNHKFYQSSFKEVVAEVTCLPQRLSSGCGFWAFRGCRGHKRMRILSCFSWEPWFY